MSELLPDPLHALRNADPSRPFVVAQLGQSLDGRIATLSGESRWINGHAALTHVHQLRANVDAVVVGVGTVLADDPLLNVRHCAGAHPARVVIDPSGRLSPKAKCLMADGARRLVIGAQRTDLPQGVEGLNLELHASSMIEPREIVTALFERGFRKLLIEGGARTVSAFVDANAVDRLHLLLGPVILGSGKAGLDLTPLARLSEARRPTTRTHVLEGGDVLIDCDLRS